MTRKPTPPPASPLAAPLILDAGALERLRALDPDGLNKVLPRVLAAFETMLLRMLAKLGPEGSDCELDTVSRVAHTLKSSAASVGAVDLARHCAEVEVRLRAAGNDCLPADVQALRAKGQSALLAVRAMLHD